MRRHRSSARSQQAFAGGLAVGQDVVVHVDAFAAGVAPHQRVGDEPVLLEGQPGVVGEFHLGVGEVGLDGVQIGLGRADLDRVDGVEQLADLRCVVGPGGPDGECGSRLHRATVGAGRPGTQADFARAPHRPNQIATDQ
jgi:hypothetical protein